MSTGTKLLGVSLALLGATWMAVALGRFDAATALGVVALWFQNAAHAMGEWESRK